MCSGNPNKRLSLLDSFSAAPAHSFSRVGKEEERSRRVTAAEVCTELAPSPLGSRRHRALTPIAAEHRPADPATVPPRHHTLAPASRGALASSPADGVALAQTIWLPLHDLVAAGRPAPMRTGFQALS